MGITAESPSLLDLLLRDLRQFVLPAVGDTAFADRLLLILRVALLGRGHDGGVDDLAAHSQKAARAQRSVEAGEQRLHDVGLFPASPETSRLCSGPARRGSAISRETA